MRIVAQIDGDLRALLQDAQNSVADALRVGVGAASAALQADLRSQVQAAGLGSGLSNAWRLQLYPTGRSLHPAGLVFSRSTVLHDVFISGATITAGSGRYLAIPTQAATAMGFATSQTSRKGGGLSGSIPRRASQVDAAIAKLGAANIRFIRLRTGRAIVLYLPPGTPRRAKSGGTVLFILVPQVRLRSRIDLPGTETRAQDRLQTEVDAALQGGLS